jgi:hypothetical protein
MGTATVRVIASLILVAIVQPPATAATDTESAAPMNRVRVMDDVLRAAFDRGMRESPTFAQLVTRLQHSDLIVHLVQGPCPSPQVIACLVSVEQRGSVRFVRINFVLARDGQRTALWTSAQRLTAHIGHELRHAVEVADTPSIVDGRSLDRAYRHQRVYWDAGRYETDAAIQTADAVYRELCRRRS